MIDPHIPGSSPTVPIGSTAPGAPPTTGSIGSSAVTAGILPGLDNVVAKCNDVFARTVAATATGHEFKSEATSALAPENVKSISREVAVSILASKLLMSGGPENRAALTEFYEIIYPEKNPAEIAAIVTRIENGIANINTHGSLPVVLLEASPDGANNAVSVSVASAADVTERARVSSQVPQPLLESAQKTAKAAVFALQKVALWHQDHTAAGSAAPTASGASGASPASTAAYQAFQNAYEALRQSEINTRAAAAQTQQREQAAGQPAASTPAQSLTVRFGTPPAESAAPQADALPETTAPQPASSLFSGLRNLFSFGRRDQSPPASTVASPTSLPANRPAEHIVGSVPVGLATAPQTLLSGRDAAPVETVVTVPVNSAPSGGGGGGGVSAAHTPASPTNQTAGLTTASTTPAPPIIVTGGVGGGVLVPVGRTAADLAAAALTDVGADDDDLAAANRGPVVTQSLPVVDDAHVPAADLATTDLTLDSQDSISNINSIVEDLCDNIELDDKAKVVAAFKALAREREAALNTFKNSNGNVAAEKILSKALKGCTLNELPSKNDATKFYNKAEETCNNMSSTGSVLSADELKAMSVNNKIVFRIADEILRQAQSSKNK